MAKKDPPKGFTVVKKSSREGKTKAAMAAASSPNGYAKVAKPPKGCASK